MTTPTDQPPASAAAAAAGGSPDPRVMNAQLIDRLLAQQPDPIGEGGYGLRVLEVPGRVSGRTQRTPIGLLRIDDRYHLVCPDRTRDWPANVAAAGRCVILGGSDRDDYRAEELTGAAAARVVARYLQVVTAPWALSAFRVPPDATPELLESAVARMAVFALISDPA